MSSFLQKILKKLYSASLQVPEYLRQWNFVLLLNSVKKRALPFASPLEKGRFSASMTVEAAICLPLFLFFAVALLQPMVWLDRQRKLQTVAEAFGEQLCQYAYLETREKENKEYDGNMAEDSDMESAAQVFSDAAAALWLAGKAKGFTDSAFVTRSDVLDPEKHVVFRLEYREKIPFFPVIPRGIRMEVATKRRAWVGINGKLRPGMRKTEAEQENDRRMVYVGANMGRYHLYRDCHYLSNQYEAIPESQARKRKNIYGVRLTPCASCSKQGKANGMVYITQAGEHYHYRKSCSSMVSYVRRIPLEEAEHLGICSACARREED